MEAATKDGEGLKQRLVKVEVEVATKGGGLWQQRGVEGGKRCKPPREKKDDEIMLQLYIRNCAKRMLQ